MKTFTTIQKIETGWRLLIETFDGKIRRKTFIDRLKLIDCLDIADILRLHIDNEAALPLQQYRKTS